MAVLLNMVLCGCVIRKEEDVMNNQMVEQFQKLMDEDKAGDGHSVEWDGKKAQNIKDEQDNPQISDGRTGFVGLDKIQKTKWSVKIDQSENYKVVSDEEDNFKIESEDWCLEIEKTDYDLAIEKLKKASALKVMPENEIDKNIREYNNRVSLFRGLKENGEQVYAGYTLVVEDFFDNSYQLSYFGKGNMNKIKGNAAMVFGAFQTEIAD